MGDWVEAIGSPFALAQTVTAGIISAKNRTIEPGASGQFQHFIQTDAAINPGNSGGPLLNMNGEVIGVNTAIYTQSAGYQGIGFAMPSNTVVSVYNDLISPSHKVTRGSIGIQFRHGLSGAVNRVYGFKNGVLVQQVQPGGPADKAGLKPGDIITTIDGRADQGRRRPGQRDRQPPARLQHSPRLPARRQAAAMPRSPSATATRSLPTWPASSRTPLRTSRATPAKPSSASWFAKLRRQTAAKLHTHGVVIQSVRTGSFADLQGLEPGLVITRINKQPTGTKDQFDAVVSKLKTGDDVVFEIIDPRRPGDGINYIGGTLQ